VKKTLSTLKFLIPSAVIVFSLAFFLVFSVQAATLAAVYIFMSRLKISLNGSSGQEVEMILAIDTASAVDSTDGASITIEFPDTEDTNWCRTAGALTVATVTSSAADLTGTNWEIDSGLPNDGTALAASCSQGGVGTPDTITISNVGDLSAGTTYGVQVSNGSAAGILGTDSTTGAHVLTLTVKEDGSPIDSKSFEIDLVNDDIVQVNATVAEIPSVDCSITGNTVNLGTLYPGGAYATGTNSISTSTSSSGYYWAAYGTGDSSTDAGLWNGTDLIPSGATATLDLTSASVDGFGITVEDPDDVGSAVVTTNFQDGTTGTFGTIDRLYSGAKLILYQNGSQTGAEGATITYGAKAASDDSAGSYVEYVYFVCGGYY